MLEECSETVGLLYAILFGAGDACIMLSMGSILTVLAAFFVVVIIAQFIARKLWVRLREPSPAPRQRRIGTIMDDPVTDDPNYDDSAIRSSRR